MTRFLYDRLRAEVAELRRRLSVVSIGGGGGGGGSHASSHENGGADEIDVTGLSGVLATPQTPAAHAATHSNGGGDDVSVLNLDGYPGGTTTFLRADASFASVSAGLHATSHQNGGSDEINVAGLSGLLADDQNPTAHASDHQNGGGDEINVAGLSGLLADDQNPTAHASDHQNGGGDEISVAGLSGMLADAQLVGVRKNSTGTVFTRSRLNLIEGANVTLTVADDGTEVDVTITSVGTGSPSGDGHTTHQITVPMIGADGADLTTGDKAMDVTVPWTGTITAWRIVSRQTGDIVIDVQRATFAAYPTMASITGGAEPELSSAQKDEDTVSWAVTAGDILDVEVLSCSGIVRCTLTLTVEIA